MSARLTQRDPQPSSSRLLADLVPPQHFAQATFTSYRPDPAHPSQSVAAASLAEFATRIGAKSRWWRRSSQINGRYLDGGFGVGKTHLLASLWHAAPGQKYFGSFLEYTQLCGALGFAETVQVLSRASLVCIDEFELDDPGDTVLMATLLSRLTAAGVYLAATSNTLPGALGQGRFAASDFLREIQTLAGSFEVLTVDGPDYRHRNPTDLGLALSNDQVQSDCAASESSSCDDFGELSEKLRSLHPSRFSMLVDDLSLVGVLHAEQLHDQATALRWVTLIDRLYDREISVRLAGVLPGEFFGPTLLTSGYRKKYLRASSRLVALCSQKLVQV